MKNLANVHIFWEGGEHLKSSSWDLTDWNFRGSVCLWQFCDSLCDQFVLEWFKIRCQFYKSKVYDCLKPFRPSKNIKSDPKWMLLLNHWYTTISGHFFAMCMFIFHKTEVQRVILICLMGLNFNWFKNYGLKCILRLNTALANSQKNGNW